MRVIQRYPLEHRDVQTVEMPHGATILSVQVQHDEIAVWAEVDPDLPKLKRTFSIYVTGDPISEEDRKAAPRHLATVQWKAIVLHIYSTQDRCKHLLPDDPRCAYCYPVAGTV